jgi:sulfite reductase (NADPH) hemoprotein beta-component
VVDSEIAGLLRPIIQRYAAERNPGEHFGDFTVRAGYVTPTGTPRDFHEAKASA